MNPVNQSTTMNHPTTEEWFRGDAMTWFKLYCEFATDPKVQSMTEPMQRRLVLIFCLTASGDLKKLTTEELCLAMRISERELEKTKELFIRKGFIDDAWSLRNWEKRQAPADPTAAERMRRYRERHRNEDRNVTGVTRNVTAPLRVDTDTDTDTEEEEEKRPPSSPRKRGEARAAFVLPEWVPRKEWDAFMEARRKLRKIPTDHAKDLLVRQLEDFRALGHDPAAILNKSTERGWTGLFAPDGYGNGRGSAPVIHKPVDEEKLRPQPIRINERMSPKIRRISIEHNREHGFPDDGVIAS